MILTDAPVFLLRPESALPCFPHRIARAQALRTVFFYVTRRKGICESLKEDRGTTEKEGGGGGNEWPFVPEAFRLSRSTGAAGTHSTDG